MWCNLIKCLNLDLAKKIAKKIAKKNLPVFTIADYPKTYTIFLAHKKKGSPYFRQHLFKPTLI